MIELEEIESTQLSIKDAIEVINGKIDYISTGKSTVDYDILSDEEKYKLVHKHIRGVLLQESSERYKRRILISTKYCYSYSYLYCGQDSKPFKEESIISTVADSYKLLEDYYATRRRK